MPRIREFNYVIIGAGSAGNVLATRLTEDVNGYQQEGFGPMDRFVTPQRRLD